MILANARQALTVILIPFSLWSGYNNILLIAGLAFLRSYFNTFFQPAFNFFIPILFPKIRLVHLNTLLETCGQLAWILGQFFTGTILSIFSLLIFIHWYYIVYRSHFSIVLSKKRPFTPIRLNTPYQNQNHSMLNLAVKQYLMLV